MTEQELHDALTPYGITITSDFAKRYQTDALVYNLVNIVVDLTKRLREFDGDRDG